MKKRDLNKSQKNQSLSTEVKDKSFDANFTLANFRDDESENVNPSLLAYHKSDKN